jgi:hypothetical protein
MLREIKEDKKQDVRSLESSKQFLTKYSQFHMHGKPYSLNELSDSLFLILWACKGSTALATKTIISTIRAITFLLQDSFSRDNEEHLCN